MNNNNSWWCLQYRELNKKKNISIVLSSNTHTKKFWASHLPRTPFDVFFFFVIQKTKRNGIEHCIGSLDKTADWMLELKPKNCVPLPTCLAFSLHVHILYRCCSCWCCGRHPPFCSLMYYLYIYKISISCILLREFKDIKHEWKMLHSLQLGVYAGTP